MRDWYNAAPAEPATATVSWDHIFTCWRSVELDFHARYRADFGAGILEHRSWRWFEMRVADLLADNTSRTARAVRPLLAIGGAHV